jgi:serine/threonine protein kinase
MVSECLQKDPSKRPTAAELLKHAFFKNKAKDRKYLQTVLVNAAPNLDARVTKRQSRKPGTSGRLHRLVINPLPLVHIDPTFLETKLVTGFGPVMKRGTLMMRQFIRKESKLPSRCPNQRSLSQRIKEP